MIPLILAAIGGYLVVDSLKDGEKFAKGGELDDKKILRYRNKLVQMNVGKDLPALDFGIALIDMILDGRLKVYSEKLPVEKNEEYKQVLRYRNKLVQFNVGKDEPALDFTIGLIDLFLDGQIVKTEKFAKGGSVGVDRASNGFKKKFVWVKEQNGVATEILQQKSFQEDFDEISRNNRFQLIRDDKGLKVFTDGYGWRITFRLKPIFAYGGQLELDFEPEEQVDESMFKARRYVQLQNMANEQIEMFGEIEDETAKEIEDLGDSLNSYEVELVMEMYSKKKFAKGGVLDRKMYVVEIYSIENDEESDDDLEKYTLRVAATDEGDAIDSAESLFVEEYGAMPIFSAKVLKSYDMGGNIDAAGDFKLSSYNPSLHDEDIRVVEFDSDEAEIEFDLYYADNAEARFLLEFDVEKRYNEYNWSLDKVYKIKGDEQILLSKEETKAIDDNPFIYKRVNELISDAIDMYEEDDFIEIDDES